MNETVDPEGNETRVIHELVDFAGQRVLEIGCGDGRLIWRYADSAATVLGLIRSKPTSITRAEARQGICIRESRFARQMP